MGVINGCLDGGLDYEGWDRARHIPAAELHDEDLISLLVAMRRQEAGEDLIEDRATIDRSRTAYEEIRLLWS